MPHHSAIVAIDDNAPAPPHAQIFEQIRALIERGEVRAGEALPPVRQLAGDLGVAPNTVARAYADLKAEGWVVSENRKVTRVAAGSSNPGKSVRRRALSDAVVLFLSSLASRGYVADEIASELRTQLPALDC